MKVNCAHCGKRLNRPPSQVKNAKNQFCNMKCLGEFRRKRIKTTCKNCGKEFEYAPSARRKFCSHSCHMQWFWSKDPKSKSLAAKNARRNRVNSPMPDKETLRRLHHDEGLTPKQIGEIYGVQGQTALKWIHGSGIQFRARYPSLKPPNKIPVPEKEALENLYIAQQLTTIQIGEYFNVSSTTVGKWLASYGIEKRPSGNGLDARGIKGPGKKLLYKMIHIDYLSYAQIAEKYSVDQSAVQYWLDKFGISRPIPWLDRYSAPDKIEQIKQLYFSGMSLREIGEHFRVSKTSVKLLFDRNEIDLRKDGFQGGRRLLCKDGHLVRSTYELRVDNWLHEHDIEHEYEPSIPGEAYLRSDFLANGWYIEVWGVNGNKEYNQKKRKKRDIYSACGLPLIEIGCHMFAKSRNNLWSRRLSTCLQSPT